MPDIANSVCGRRVLASVSSVRRPRSVGSCEGQSDHYRIGAEALTNAVRHSEVARIDVALARNESTATIEVGDDGRGLPPTRRPGANGLRSMGARAETLSRELLDAAGTQLEPADLPILGMTLDDTPLSEIADALNVDPRDVSRRIDRMIQRLKTEIPSPV